jgi:hypothetical protein
VQEQPVNRKERSIMSKNNNYDIMRWHERLLFFQEGMIEYLEKVKAAIDSGLIFFKDKESCQDYGRDFMENFQSISEHTSESFNKVNVLMSNINEKILDTKQKIDVYKTILREAGDPRVK